MNPALRRGAVAVLVVLSAACSGSTSPLEPSSPLTHFPPLSGASRIFVFDHALSYPVSNATKNSQFVLYDNGAFVLQYLTVAGNGNYRGGYTNVNGVVTFGWEDSNTAGPWVANGTLNGSSLTVQYQGVMQLDDFEDAAYVLAP